MRSDDAERVRQFLEGISSESIVFRFFGVPNLTWVTEWSVDVDYSDRFALVAETGTPAAIIAHAAYVRSAPDRAEIAFLVTDEFQGYGISSALLGHLAAVAERNGISTFTAEVMPSNHRMIETFRLSGFPVDVRSSADAIHIELPTSLTPEALDRFNERSREAAVAAVRSLLEPRSVAVVGAGRRRGSISGELIHNVISAGFNGPVYAVNPRAESVQGLKSFPSVSAIPGDVDLAVVVVPAAEVLDVARDCGRAGVRTLVVISAGFAETGPEGVARQQELVHICRTAGIRIVGPNCLGVINTDPDVRLNATFAPRPALPGKVGFMSQSGGVGVAIMEAAFTRGLGLSSFVAVGNKSDLSGNDMLSYWEQDPSTVVALLYLESFGNPRKFARVAPRFARNKPLLAVKSGRSAAGSRSTRSHTGALLGSSDVTVDALFEQAGVIRTDTLHELFAVAQLLTSQPLPAGDRVAIVSNAGGPAIMCADACEADGVVVPELEPSVQERLREFLNAGAHVRNPVDMLAASDAADYAHAVEVLAESGACDAVLTIFVPSLRTTAHDVAQAIHGAAERFPQIPIAAVFMTEDPPPLALRSVELQVPGYEFPEDAARAVALAAKYGRWRTRPRPAPAVLPDIDPDRAAALLSAQIASGEQWMVPERVNELLGCYGLRVADAAAETEAAAADGEVTMRVGVETDPSFGPVMACAAGGAAGELLRDVAVRLTPVSPAGAAEMIRSLKTFPLLDGYRGAAPADLKSLERLIVRISAIVEHHREIIELTCDPIQVGTGGTTIVAAEVHVMAAPPAAPMPSLASF